MAAAAVAAGVPLTAMEVHLKIMAQALQVFLDSGVEVEVDLE